MNGGSSGQPYSFLNLCQNVAWARLILCYVDGKALLTKWSTVPPWFSTIETTRHYIQEYGFINISSCWSYKTKNPPKRELILRLP